VTKTDDGLEPRNLKVYVHPPGPEARLLGDGRFTLTGLQPGTYALGVGADGYLLRRAEEVIVTGGNRYRVDLWLERGIELAGRVIDDVDQRPIQGAFIDFNGLAQATSDASGSFSTGLVSPKAVDVITVTHDDYDRAYLIHPVVAEPKGITLAMSRGKGTVTGRIIQVSGQELPATIRVRLWRVVMPGHEELRRERVLRGTDSFEITGVFDGSNVIEVAVPGTTIASRRIEFDLNRRPAGHFEIDLNGGSRVDGTYTSTSGIVGLQPVTLVDGSNHVMGETRTDSKGKFRFDQVLEGEYALRMEGRIPPIYTQSFRVEDGKVATVTVDGQTGRLK
jgi:hypothetical protein